MKRKFLMCLAAICSVAGLVFGLSACEKDNTSLGHDFTNYVSDNNASYEADGTKTAKCEHAECEETDTIPDVGSKLPSELSFKTLSVDGTSVYGKVSNATESFSLKDEIQTTGFMQYIVSLDPYGTQSAPLKIVSLASGDNTFYVIEMLEGEPKTVYEVTIRRRPMYTVSFNSNGGTAVDSQTIEEDFCASVPTEESARVGYTFDKWDFDFATPITSNTTIAAKWTANTNTPYKVEYYLQNLENDEYTLKTTENKTGTTDTTATAEIKTFAHFTHKPTATDSGNIDGNGSRALKVYYTRDQYTVTFDGNGGALVNGSATQTVKYGGSAVAPTFTKTGYSVEKWDKPLGNISESQTITAQWKINQYTVRIVYGNGQPNKTITQDYNTSIELKNPTARAGYTFDGWDKELIVPAYGTTITAKWLAIFRVYGDSVTGLTDHGKTFTKIVVPSEIDGVKITSIGNYAFYGCSKLTSVTISDSVTSIGDSAFEYCSGLTSVTIPDSVTSIGNGAFSGCDNLQYNEHDNAKYLGNETNPYVVLLTAQSTDITSCTINENCKIVYKNAFSGCSGLTSVTIPDSVTSIGRWAFYGCSGLTSVTIGNSVTSIGALAFPGCYKLASVYYGGTIDEWVQIAFESYESNPLYYAKKLYIDNKLVTEANITTATKISACAFYGYDSLTSVTIGNGVTSIGCGAFSGCSKLANITFRDTTTWYRTSNYNGWVNKRNGVSVNVTNSSTNATYFYVDVLRLLLV